MLLFEFKSVMAQVNDNHRYFVQYMLKKGVVAVEDAQNYCHNISQGEIGNLTQLKTMVIEVNREISKQFFKIVLNICEVTNESYLIWVNTKNDNISKLQITFSALELEYFNAVFQEILKSEEHRITYIVCINITSTLTAFLSRDNGQTVLTKWINKGYFVKKDAHIYLGPRLILEFTSYLKAHLPDSICTLCSELVFWGETCSSCNKTLHSYCIQRYLSNQTNCPHCSVAWSSTRLHDASNMDVDEDEQISQITSLNRTNSKSLSNFITTPAENKRSNTEDDYSDDDLNVPGPSTRKRHR